MSFLSVLKKIGGIGQEILTVSTNPLVAGIISKTPIGAEYLAVVDVILRLENMAPAPNMGPAKAAIAIPAIQAQFPNATEDSVKQFNTDLVAAFNRFSDANQPQPVK